MSRNIEKAIEAFKTRSGVTSVTSLEVTQEVITPKGRGSATNKLAFIWIDNLQYELIQPISGLVDVYTDALPDNDSMKFHHICTRVDDWNDFRARVDKAGYPVVLEGGSGDALKYLYLDARDYVGHYIEYVWMTDERWTSMAKR